MDDNLMRDLIEVLVAQNERLEMISHQIERVAGQLTFMNNTNKENSYKKKYGAALSQGEFRRYV